MAETEYISRDADANGPEPLPVRAFTAHAPPADPSVPLLGPAFVRVAESDEDFFQNLLDDDEFNHSTRLLLADWLAERPISPKEILATTYHLLGIDPETTIRDRTNRPMPLVQAAAMPEVLA